MSEEFLDQDTMKRLEQLALVSRKISSGRLKGERRSRRRGSSNDFADYRNYVAGDDLRFLDWKIYGRLERLFIKLFLEEEDLRVNILIDTSPSMDYGSPQKLLYAKRLAAVLGYICLSKMDSLTVYPFGDTLGKPYGPKRGKVNGAKYFDYLSKIEPLSSTHLYNSFKSFAQSNRLKGMVIVISDFYDFEGHEEAFRHLFAGNYEVLAIHVLSPEELKPTHQGDIRLVDCEFDFSTDVSMGKSITDMYERTINAFCKGLKEYVIARGGYYMVASTATSFENMVFDVLCRRGLIR